MGLHDLLRRVKIAAITCFQWGDSGKGKLSDFLSAYWADVIARGTGGNNAGHTVILNGREKIFHLLPSGILHDSKGKINVLGNGMVIDLPTLIRELDDLDREGLSYNNLMISQDANVIMPYHINRDKAKNISQKKGGIGTTGRGIGPCYADKIARRGIRVEDLFDKDKLVRKINKASEFYTNQEINPDEIIASFEPYIQRIKPFVRNTVNEMHNFVKQDKKILLEGAQGLLLSIEHGTYPYVTSSDCSLNGTATGVGLPASVVDLSLGVIKFPFMTRVGAGPFPTELGGSKSEEYCASGLEHDIFFEAKEYLGMPLDLTKVRRLQSENDLKSLAKEKQNIYGFIKSNRGKVLDLCNSQDPFIQGIGIRLAAGEYGATTARPRRTGWTDAVAAKYAVGINGPLMVLTKLDCVSGIDEFKLCYGYNENGSISLDFSRDENFLRGVKPEYKSYKGYDNISSIKNYQELPSNLKQAIEDFESFTGGKVVALSTGAERDEMIVR